ARRDLDGVRVVRVMLLKRTREGLGAHTRFPQLRARSAAGSADIGCDLLRIPTWSLVNVAIPPITPRRATVREGSRVHADKRRLGGVEIDEQRTARISVACV